MRVPITLHACQHLALLVFQIWTILIGVQWYPTVVLICTSKMTYNVEYLYIRFLPSISFFNEVSVKVLGAFFNQVVFLWLSFKGTLYILENSPLLDVFLQILSPILCLSSSLHTVFYRVEICYFNKVRPINYFFHRHIFGVVSKKASP